MSMSRKDYEAVAAIFRYERETIPTEAGDYNTDAAFHTVDSIEGQFICMFSNDNPRFDPVRFRKAAQP